MTEVEIRVKDLTVTVKGDDVQVEKIESELKEGEVSQERTLLG